VHHVGDFAYDMEEQQSSVGNKFQELASQSYAARFPVAVVPGNHVRRPCAAPRRAAPRRAAPRP
jgi:hypothetical protein